MRLATIRIVDGVFIDNYALGEIDITHVYMKRIDGGEIPFASWEASIPLQGTSELSPSMSNSKPSKRFFRRKSMGVYEIVTERVLDYIKQNECLPWRKPWASISDSVVPRNFKSGNPYNGINAILTGMSGFASPYWLTFKQAKAMGGMVKKGSKSTPVVYWNTLEKEVEDDDEAETKKVGFYRLYSVFNAEQIEGIDFPAIAPPVIHDFSPIEEAEQVFQDMHNRPMLAHGGTSAYYSPTLDRVVLPVPESFVSQEEYYSSLFHEVAHSTGHPSRLNRFAQEGDDNKFNSQAYSKEELVAEISSCFVLNTIGINTEASDTNSAAYIKSWLKALRNDPRMVVQAAGKAGKAANYIMNKENENV